MPGQRRQARKVVVINPASNSNFDTEYDSASRLRHGNDKLRTDALTNEDEGVLYTMKVAVRLAAFVMETGVPSFKSNINSSLCLTCFFSQFYFHRICHQIASSETDECPEGGMIYRQPKTLREKILRMGLYLSPCQHALCSIQFPR